MDHDAQTEQPDENMEQEPAIPYPTLVRDRLRDQPETYNSFMEAIYKYRQERINMCDLLNRVWMIFREHPDLFKGFCQYVPITKDDDAMKALRPAKRAKTDSANPMTEFASHSSGSFPVNWGAGTSSSISSQYRPENGAGTSGSSPSQARQGNLDEFHVEERKEFARSINRSKGTLHFMSQGTVDRAGFQTFLKNAKMKMQKSKELMEDMDTFLPDGLKMVSDTNGCVVFTDSRDQIGRL